MLLRVGAVASESPAQRIAALLDGVGTPRSAPWSWRLMIALPQSCDIGIGIDGAAAADDAGGPGASAANVNKAVTNVDENKVKFFMRIASRNATV